MSQEDMGKTSRLAASDASVEAPALRPVNKRAAPKERTLLPQSLPRAKSKGQSGVDRRSDPNKSNPDARPRHGPPESTLMERDPI